MVILVIFENLCFTC